MYFLENEVHSIITLVGKTIFSLENVLFVREGRGGTFVSKPFISGGHAQRKGGPMYLKPPQNYQDVRFFLRHAYR